MKKALVLSMVFASNMAFAGQPVDAVSVANLMKHGVTKDCIEQVEEKAKAQLSISEVTKSEANGTTTYTLSGVLLRGGDMAVGNAALEISGSYQFPWGFAYQCKVLSNEIFD